MKNFYSKRRKQATNINTCKRHQIKDCYPKHTKIHLKLNNKKINNLIKEQAKDVKRHIINEDTQMASNHMKKSSIPCITRGKQIETTRYYYKCIRMAKL